MTAKYNELQLDEKFVNIHEKLDLILEQTTKTNGRVSTLEAIVDQIKGGLKVGTTIIVPVILWLFYNSVSVK